MPCRALVTFFILHGNFYGAQIGILKYHSFVINVLGRWIQSKVWNALVINIHNLVLSLLVIRDEKHTTENLAQLRAQIDECDNQLIEVLAKRMRVCREIGTFKKEHGMTVLQTTRYNEILDKRGAQATLCGMSAELIKRVFEAIHEDSVRQQMEIINQ